MIRGGRTSLEKSFCLILVKADFRIIGFKLAITGLLSTKFSKRVGHYNLLFISIISMPIPIIFASATCFCAGLIYLAAAVILQLWADSHDCCEGLEADRFVECRWRYMKALMLQSNNYDKAHTVQTKLDFDDNTQRATLFGQIVMEPLRLDICQDKTPYYSNRGVITNDWTNWTLVCRNDRL